MKEWKIREAEITEIADGDERVEVTVDFPGSLGTIIFRVSGFSDDPNAHEDCDLEVNMYEDQFEKVSRFDSSIKHFWIALLWKNV